MSGITFRRRETEEEAILREAAQRAGKTGRAPTPVDWKAIEADRERYREEFKSKAIGLHLRDHLGEKGESLFFIYGLGTCVLVTREDGSGYLKATYGEVLKGYFTEFVCEELKNYFGAVAIQEKDCDGRYIWSWQKFEWKGPKGLTAEDLWHAPRKAQDGSAQQ